jgi:hypothetical protein
MTDRSRFAQQSKQEQDKAKADHQRTIQKEKLVRAGQLNLWQNLRATAQGAVERANQAAGHRILTFYEDPIVDAAKFEIGCLRAGERLSAIVAYNGPQHNVVLEIKNPRKVQIVSLTIEANNNNQLEFATKAARYTVQQVVEIMLNSIL